MLALVKYIINHRVRISADAELVKTDTCVKVSESFLEVLKLSFKIKNYDEMSKSSKKKKMIQTIKAKMDDLFQSTTVSTNTTLDNIVVLAITYFNMGVIYADSTEEKELHTSRDYFTKCIILLEGYELERKVILLALSVVIELSHVLMKLQKRKESTFLLEKAMNLYVNYQTGYCSHPINILKLLNIEESIFQNSIHELHFMTMDHLIQQYHLWPNDKNKLVGYMHFLLDNQIVDILESLDIKCYYWALSSVDLSQHFISKYFFTEARHYLAAADYVMEKLHKEKLMITDNKILSDSLHALMYDKYKHACAIIARYWGFYGVTLLRSSKERLCQENSECCTKDDSKLQYINNHKMNFIFTDLEEELKSITSQITDTYVSNLDEAKAVFVNVLRWLNVAKSYFTLEKDSVNYGKIMIEISKAYKYLAYFEQSTDKRIKLCKLQIETLENAIKDMHPIIKTNKLKLIDRHISFELGIAYTVLIDTKIDRMDIDLIKQVTHLSAETLQLIKSAVKHFNTYSNAA